MKRTLFVVAAVVGFATAASAATLTVSSDQATYNIGDTITLTVVGDSQGGADTSIFGRLLYDASLTTTVSASQTQLISFGGFVMWNLGVLPLADGEATVFNQIGGLSPVPVDNLLTATATLVADASGVVNVDWLQAGGTTNLDFFGITNSVTQGGTAGITSFTIVPEPTTAALLGLGLFGLALTGRRRS